MPQLIRFLILLALLTPAAAWAQPSVASTNHGATTVTGTSHTVNLPAGCCTSGDLVIVLFCRHSNNGATFPSGWTSEIFTPKSGTGGVETLYGQYRVADGTEGSTITVTTSDSVHTSHQTYRITTGTYSGTPSGSTAGDTGTEANPDPPSHAPAWGSANDLWIPASCVPRGTSHTAFPTNYGDTLDDASSGGSSGTGLGSARRTLTASSEDPTTFTVQTPDNQWATATIAVQPAAAAGSGGRSIIGIGVGRGIIQ